MIKIVCLGKIKEDYLKKAIDDYQKRINKYHKLEIIELKDNLDIRKETEELLNVIDDKDYIIVMDIEKEQIGSTALAYEIDKIFTFNSNITFIIGSSNGLSNLVKEKANKCYSFGKITMPHGLFRLVLLEQIYRAFKINNHESYHK